MRPVALVVCLGPWFSFAGLNTKLKKKLRLFFSDGGIAVEPSLLIEIGISLNESLGFMCFQKFLGADFASNAIFFSCSFSACLVASQTLFHTLL